MHCWHLNNGFWECGEFSYRKRSIITRFWILTIHKARILRKKSLEKTFLDFKMWIKSIQTVGFNGAHTVCTTTFKGWYKINLVSEKHLSHMLHVTTNSRQNIKFWLQTLFVTCPQIQQPILNLRILNFHGLFFWIIWKMSKKKLENSD